MANEIDRAVVKVVADARGLRTSIRTKVAEYNRTPVDAKVRVVADETATGVRSLRASIKRAVAEASKGMDVKVKLGVEIDRRSLAQALRNIPQQTVTVRVKYDYGRGAQAPSTPSRATSRTTNAFQRTAEERGRIALNRAHAQAIEEQKLLDLYERRLLKGKELKRIEETYFSNWKPGRSRPNVSSLDDDRKPPPPPGNRGRGRDRYANTLRTLGGSGSAPAALGALVGTGLLNITPITTALIGLSSAAAVAGTGIAAFGGVAVAHLNNVGDTLKGLREGTISVQELSPAFQTLIPAINSFQISWRQIMDSTRQPVFEVFAAGLNTVESNLPKLVPLVNAMANGFRNAFSIIGDTLNSSEITGFLEVVRTQAPSALASLTQSASNLTAGLLEIFTGFAPAGQDMLTTVEQLTERFRAWAGSLRGSEGFSEFLAYARENGPQVLTTLADIAEAIGKIIVGLAPLGDVASEVLGGVAALLQAISPEVWSAITTAVVGLFVASKLLLIFGKLDIMVRTFATAIQIAAVASRSGASAFGAAATGAAALGVSLRSLLISTGVGAVLVGLGLALQAVIGSTSSASEVTNSLTSSQLELADALEKSNGLMTEQVKTAALNDLKNSGFLGAGKNIGVSPAEIAKAYSGGEATFQPFLDELQKRNMDLRSQYAQAVKDMHEAGNDAEYNAALGRASSLNQQYLNVQNFIDKGNVLINQFREGKISATDFASGMSALGTSTESATAGVLNASTVLENFQRLTQQKSPEQQISSHLDGVLKQYRSLSKARDDAFKNQGKVRDQTREDEERAREGISDAQDREREAADAVVEANKRIRESIEGVKEAEKNYRDSIKAVVEAREQARRQIRDSYDEEESANIRLAQARERELLTRGLTADNLERREAVLGLKNAQEDVSDLGKDNRTLRAGGVEGNPAVVAAKQQQADAKKAIEDARDAVVKANKDAEKAAKTHRDAVKDVNKAQSNYHKTLLDGQEARAKARQDYVDSKTAVDEFKGSLSAIERDFIATVSVNDADAKTKINELAVIMESLRLMSVDGTMSYSAARNLAEINLGLRANPTTPNRSKIGGGKGNSRYPKEGLATGGPVPGVGSGKIDTVDAVLAPGEHVWTAEEVSRAGGHTAVASLRSAVRGFARGGPVEIGPSIDINRMGIVDRFYQQLIKGDKKGPSGPVQDPQSRLLAFAKFLQGQDVRISEHPNFGGVGKHSSGSRHYVGAAFDANFGPGGENDIEKAKFDQLYDDAQRYGLRTIWRNIIRDATGRVIGRAGGHMNHLHVDYPSGSGDQSVVPDSPWASLPPGVPIMDLDEYFRGGAGDNGAGVTGASAIKRVAEAKARAMGATNKQLLALFEAGFAESGFKNYANRKVKSSLKIPHDAVGSDGYSVGFLQQQVGSDGTGRGWSWGTVAEAMNPAEATRKFINRAKARDRSGLSAHMLAQKVQVSAFEDGSNYLAQRSNAYSALNEEAPGIPAGIYDSGGILKPGSAAINLSSQEELVLNQAQLRAMGMTDADMRRFAAYVAQALQTRPGLVQLGERAVGEFVRETIAEALRLG